MFYPYVFSVKSILSKKCVHTPGRILLLLLLLSHFSRVRLRETPETAAHQAPPSLGFSRQYPKIHQIWIVNQANQNYWPKEIQKKNPIKVIQTATRVRLRDPPPESHHVPIHMYCTPFSPNKHLTCITTFCLCGNSFL